MQPSENSKAYLQAVLAQVRWKQAHDVISRDLSDHIEDQTEAYFRGGIERDAALERAVEEMGDPVDVGLMLDASYRPRIALRLLLALGTLVLAGILIRAIFYRLTAVEWVSYAIALFIGVGCFVLTLRINLYKALKWAWHLEIAFLLIACVVPILWDWLSDQIGIVHFNYAYVQFLWLLYPVIYAFVVYRMRGSNLFGLAIAGALFCVPLFARAIRFTAIGHYEIDAAAACFVIIMLAIQLKCFRGNRVIAFVLTLLVTGFGTLLTAVSEPYRFARLHGMLYPSNDPLGDGWLTLRIQELVGKAVIWGRGGVLSPESQSFLDQNASFTSNYVMSYLIYEYGYIVAIFLILLVIAFLCFGFTRARRLGSQLGKLLSSGILIVFSMQAFLYVLPCIGYPFTSSAFFPFVTDGNLVLVIDFMLAGLLLSLFRTDTLYSDKPPRKWKQLRLRFSVDVGFNNQD